MIPETIPQNCLEYIITLLNLIPIFLEFLLENQL